MQVTVMMMQVRVMMMQVRVKMMQVRVKMMQVRVKMMQVRVKMMLKDKVFFTRQYFSHCEQFVPSESHPSIIQ